MPEIPPEIHVAVQKAFWDTMKSYGLDYSDPAWHSLRAALDAAAPMFAEAVAQKITAHKEAHGPQPASPGLTLHATMRRAWHRHFGIAVRVAAGAFDTREDQLRQAAEAIERGQFIACDIPEVPREH